jgi:hypothetical protein
MEGRKYDVQYHRIQLIAIPNAVSFSPMMVRRAKASRTIMASSSTIINVV